MFPVSLLSRDEAHAPHTARSSPMANKVTDALGPFPGHHTQIWEAWPDAPLWLGNLDLSRGEFDDFPVPWDCRALPVAWVEVDSVVASLAQEPATVTFEMTKQILPFHDAGRDRGSRITSSPARDSSASWRLASRTSSTASA